MAWGQIAPACIPPRAPPYRGRESGGRLRLPTWSGPEGSSQGRWRRVARLLFSLRSHAPPACSSVPAVPTGSAAAQLPLMPGGRSRRPGWGGARDRDGERAVPDRVRTRLAMPRAGKAPAACPHPGRQAHPLRRYAIGPATVAPLRGHEPAWQGLRSRPAAHGIAALPEGRDGGEVGGPRRPLRHHARRLSPPSPVHALPIRRPHRGRGRSKDRHVPHAAEPHTVRDSRVYRRRR